MNSRHSCVYVNTKQLFSLPYIFSNIFKMQYASKVQCLQVHVHCLSVFARKLTWLRESFLARFNTPWRSLTKQQQQTSLPRMSLFVKIFWLHIHVEAKCHRTKSGRNISRCYQHTLATLAGHACYSESKMLNWCTPPVGKSAIKLAKPYSVRSWLEPTLYLVVRFFPCIKITHYILLNTFHTC